MTHLTDQDLGCTSHTPRDELDSEIIPLFSWRFGIGGNGLGCVRHLVLFFSMILKDTVASNPFTLVSDLYYSYLSDQYGTLARHHTPPDITQSPFRLTESITQNTYTINHQPILSCKVSHIKVCRCILTRQV
jgi:hypothetical protein